VKIIADFLKPIRMAVQGGTVSMPGMAYK